MALVVNHLKSDLRKFLLVAVCLVLVGLIFIYSSSSVFALEKFGNAAYFLKRQLAYLLLGIVGFFAFALIPKEFFKKYALIFFIGSIALTLLTFVPVSYTHLRRRRCEVCS